jgi:hypothetical protein
VEFQGRLFESAPVLSGSGFGSASVRSVGSSAERSARAPVAVAALTRDAAAVGVYPFDFHDKAQEYRIVKMPKRAVAPDDLPSDLRELLVVKLATAEFAQGVVTRAQIDGALSL